MAEEGLPPVSISVGVTHGTDASDTEDLFEKADAALYQAKHGGKHSCRFYSPSAGISA